MTGVSVTQWLVAAFWIAGAVDLIIVATWVSGSLAAHDNLLVTLFWFAIGLLLAGVMVAFALVHNPVFRVLAFAVMLAPLTYQSVDAAKDYAVRRTYPSKESLDAGHGYFKSPGDRALADAVVAGDASRVAALAPAADIKAVGFGDMTFLKLALDRRDAPVVPEVVAALLRAGADPDRDGLLFSVINSGRNLNVMFARKNEPLLRAVLATGIDLNHPDRDGNPRFFSALDWPEALTLMLEHGVNLEAVDAKGNTAIMDAVIYGEDCWPSIDVLLKHGARTDHVAHDGQSLRDLVKDYFAVGGRSPPQLAKLYPGNEQPDGSTK